MRLQTQSKPNPLALQLVPRVPVRDYLAQHEAVEAVTSDWLFSTVSEPSQRWLLRQAGVTVA